VLPFTAILDGEGGVLATKVGAYSASELAAALEKAERQLRR